MKIVLTSMGSDAISFWLMSTFKSWWRVPISLPSWRFHHKKISRVPFGNEFSQLVKGIYLGSWLRRFSCSWSRVRPDSSWISGDIVLILLFARQRSASSVNTHTFQTWTAYQQSVFALKIKSLRSEYLSWKEGKVHLPQIQALVHLSFTEGAHILEDGLSTLLQRKQLSGPIY